MTDLPRPKKPLPPGTKVTMAAVASCPLVKVWTQNSVTVGWLVDSTPEFVDLISTASSFGNGWRHRIEHNDITGHLTLQEP